MEAQKLRCSTPLLKALLLLLTTKREASLRLNNSRKSRHAASAARLTKVSMKKPSIFITGRNVLC